MSAMSRNSSSSQLMGFSVHQPALGAALQFFPAMGTKELDDMIDAYVPGNASILDKRTVVSIEFFDHTLQTGELFKFFLVYPSAGSNATSPASSSAWHDSSYGSGFNPSPVLSEDQGAQSSSASFKARSPADKMPISRSQTAQDFSHIPGMKIMTREGLDVTNAASRGCKTKEQRDHAHLMRIIKACDSCKRKKTRCDPSHKKRSATQQSSSPEIKTAKKARTAVTTAYVPVVIPSFAEDSAPAETLLEPSTSVDDGFPPLLEPWEQFIQFEDSPVQQHISFDYDFFSDPDGHFSPTASTSTGMSPPEPVTPAQAATTVPIDGYASSFQRPREVQQPTLPYLHPEGLEIGNDYVDFNLYSPASTYGDEDLALVKESSELSASPATNTEKYILRPRTNRTQQIQHAFFQEADLTVRRDVPAQIAGEESRPSLYVSTRPTSTVTLEAEKSNTLLYAKSSSMQQQSLDSNTSRGEEVQAGLQASLGGITRKHRDRSSPASLSDAVPSSGQALEPYAEDGVDKRSMTLSTSATRTASSAQDESYYSPAMRISVSSSQPSHSSTTSPFSRGASASATSLSTSYLETRAAPVQTSKPASQSVVQYQSIQSIGNSPEEISRLDSQSPSPFVSPIRDCRGSISTAISHPERYTRSPLQASDAHILDNRINSIAHPTHYQSQQFSLLTMLSISAAISASVDIECTASAEIATTTFSAARMFSIFVLTALLWSTVTGGQKRFGDFITSVTPRLAESTTALAVSAKGLQDSRRIQHSRASVPEALAHETSLARQSLVWKVAKDTVDNVKSKIHGLVQEISNLRCTNQQRMRKLSSTMALYRV